MNIDGISVPFCHPPQQAIGYRQCGLLMVSRAVTDIFKHRCIAGNPIASGVAVISLSSDPIRKIYEFFITQANAFAVRRPGSLK